MGFRSFVDTLKGSKVSKDKNAEFIIVTPDTLRQGSSKPSQFTTTTTTVIASEPPRAKAPGRRKSFFRSRNEGPILDASEQPMPMLKQSRSEFFHRSEPEVDLTRPGSAHADEDYRAPRSFSTADIDDASRRKARHASLTQRLSRRLSRSNLTAGEEATALPPMPPMPKTTPAPLSINPTAANRNSVAEKSKHKRTASGQNATGTRSRAHSQSLRRRSHIWASSNPDDDDVPPTPALVRDETPSPRSPRSARSHRSTLSIDRNQSTGGESAAAPSRPTSSYVPRSAAKGFLSSTSVASAATRRSWRQSGMFENNGGAEPVCLTEAHQREWEKLKALMGSIEGRPSGFDVDDEATLTSDHASRDGQMSPMSDRTAVAGALSMDEDSLARSRALAALEFGTAR